MWNLERSFLHNSICDKCMADVTEAFPFEDCSLTAEWAKDAPPAFSLIPGCETEAAILPDLFHIGPLGILTLGWLLIVVCVNRFPGPMSIMDCLVDCLPKLLLF